ncbi:hypothetical protein K2173_010361 [Erythroxylum novogranatense]|uniref:Protein ABIL2-like n=1 Tax=Erythroxylum novogranatense TaxID=1862640 RepID=A0AAV8TEN8_9ROSI|nr:hypothetical protein K2173_010361 [Erythroxylum novogranatense]
MESSTWSSSFPGLEGASNPDEFIMQQSLIFSDTLKDLKNVRKQLYSAADYYEISYNKVDEQKQIVLETLKNYLIHALISTVDHLGSVAYKVNTFFDEKVEEISNIELHLSCLEQRVKTCQEYTNQGGLLQQSLMIYTPKYHKSYIFSEGNMDAVDGGRSKHHSRTTVGYNLEQFKQVPQATIKRAPSPSRREWNFKLPSPKFSLRQGTFAFAKISDNKQPEKRAASSQRFPLLRTRSILKRPTSPNHSTERQQYPTQTQRSVSWSRTVHAERERMSDIQLYSSKSRRLFQALLSVRKSREDDRTGKN